MNEGLYINIEELEDGCWLHLTEEGEECLVSHIKELVDDDPEHSVYGYIEFDNSYISIWLELLEDWMGNNWAFTSEGDHSSSLGLTSAPILVYGPAYNDEGLLTGDCDRVYWFPNYAIESELETLLEKGKVWFQRGEQDVPSSTV